MAYTAVTYTFLTAFSKYSFWLFDLCSAPAVVLFFWFTRSWPYVVTSVPFGGFDRSKKAKCSFGSRETPYFF